MVENNNSEKQKICFDAVYRKKLKRKYTRELNKTVKILEKFENLNYSPDIQSRIFKVQWEKLVDFYVGMLEAINIAESNSKVLEITDCRYDLYKRKGRTGYIFKYSFFRPITKENKVKYLKMDCEYLTETKRSFKILNKCSTKNYEKIDEGEFIVSFKNFDNILFQFKGKDHCDIDCTAERSINDYDWLLVFI